MRRMLTAAVVFGFIFLAGCKKAPEVVTVTEWDRYEDQYLKYTFHYPKGWQLAPEPGKAAVYSSQDAVQKFFDPTSKAADGAQVVVRT